jgi:hypothetical protein
MRPERRGACTPHEGKGQRRIIEQEKRRQMHAPERSSMMDTWVWIVIACVIAAIVLGVLALVGMMRSRQMRTRDLRGSFGPEYDRAVDEYGGRNEAERALQQRQQRVERLRLHDLTAEQRQRFDTSWQKTQAQFVDEPAQAVSTASALVDEAMKARGYPVGDFDQKAADISVDHPYVVQNYRAGRDLARRNEQGEASTEDLRQAMVHYRGLFVELVNTNGDVPDIEAGEEREDREEPRGSDRPERGERRRGDPRESMRRRSGRT